MLAFPAKHKRVYTVGDNSLSNAILAARRPTGALQAKPQTFPHMPQNRHGWRLVRDVMAGIVMQPKCSADSADSAPPTTFRFTSSTRTLAAVIGPRCVTANLAWLCYPVGGQCIGAVQQGVGRPRTAGMPQQHPGSRTASPHTREGPAVLHVSDDAEVWPACSFRVHAMPAAKL